MRLLLRLLVLLLGLTFAPAIGVFPLPVHAQDNQQAIDYAAWEAVATRAENALADAKASDAALNDLRKELVGWRDQFLAAQTINKTRVETLKGQIEALGPPPSDGTTEPAEIAARRAELNNQLAALEAPRLKAEEAYSRADGMIGEIDTIIRRRQTEKLFSLGPSPLVPDYWIQSVRALAAFASGVSSEVGTSLTTETQRVRLKNNLPKVLFFLVVAGVLLVRGRHWMEQLAERFQRSETARGRGFYGFLFSLGQVVLPVAGIYALVEAISATGLPGLRGQLFAQELPRLGLAFFGSRWLALRLFPLDDRAPMMVRLDRGARARARRFAILGGLSVGVSWALAAIAAFERFAPEVEIVPTFVLILTGGTSLFFTGRLLLGEPKETAAHDDVEQGFRHRAIGLLARGAMAVGVIGPALGALGYGAAAEYVVFPSILTLFLFGLLAVLGGALRDGWALVFGISERDAGSALGPVLLNFVLFLAASPVFALIWGARWADLTELWARVQQGLQIGDTRISPSDFLTFAVVFAIGYVLTRVLQSTLRGSVLPRTRLDPGAQNAIESGVGYVGIFLAALVAITTAGIDLSSLAIVAGALSVGIGFGLQNIVSNFVSGIILLIERPISEGDWIEVGGQQGYVRDISVRSTRIETFDRTDVIVPNADLISGPVTNFTRGNLIGRAVIGVGVAYGTDTRKVERILREIAEAHPMVTMNPKPGVHLVRFGADALEFEIRAILRDVNYVLTVRSDINHEIVRRFAEEGIEIPFAQRDVWLRNPEALRLAGEGEAQ